MYVAYAISADTGTWQRIFRLWVRKFVSHPLIDALTAHVTLLWQSAQHRVDARRLVSILEPQECMLVVTEPPVDRAVAQLVQHLAVFASTTPTTGPHVLAFYVLAF